MGKALQFCTSSCYFAVTPSLISQRMFLAGVPLVHPSDHELRRSEFHSESRCVFAYNLRTSKETIRRKCRHRLLENVGSEKAKLSSVPRFMIRSREAVCAGVLTATGNMKGEALRIC